LKIRVRLFPHGRVRTRQDGIRGFAMLLALASVVWVMLGPASVTVAAAGASAGAVEGFGGGRNHDPHHRCGHAPPKSSRFPTPAPVATPGPRAPSAPVTRRAPAKSAPGSAPHPKSATPNPEGVVPTPSHAPVLERPPLLGPPVLTEPAPIAPVAVPVSSVLIYTLTLSALVASAAVSVAALVHVRRTG
jgi:hypothetical protein